MQEGAKVATEDEHRMSGNHRQTSLDPLPHGVAMDAEQPGGLFYGVVPVDLREPVVRGLRHGLTGRSLSALWASREPRIDV